MPILASRFAHRFAQTPDFAVHLGSSRVSEATLNARSQKTKTPLISQGFFSFCHHDSLSVTSSGGGTRTPDTRIMIPLL